MTKPVGYLINSPDGLVGEPGVFYNYILAGNGLFIKAKNSHFEAVFPIAEQEVRGLTPLETSFTMLHGYIPSYLREIIFYRALAGGELELFLAITWEDGIYRLREPNQVRSGGSVSYETLPNMVMELHSHPFTDKAHPSSIDNADEKGFRLYAVIGTARALAPSLNIRLGVYGYYLPLAPLRTFSL